VLFRPGTRAAVSAFARRPLSRQRSPQGASWGFCGSSDGMTALAFALSGSEHSVTPQSLLRWTWPLGLDYFRHIYPFIVKKRELRREIIFRRAAAIFKWSRAQLKRM
jgi:hypothetical protein